MNYTPEFCLEHYGIDIYEFLPLISISLNTRNCLVVFTKQFVDKTKYSNMEEMFIDEVNDGYHYYFRKISLNK